jgi:hypothetical protein
MKDLTRIEEILLLSIWRLKDNAYDVIFCVQFQPS